MKLLLQAWICGCDGQSRRLALRHTARVCLRASRLRVPVSLRVCTLSRRTFMNHAGEWPNSLLKEEARRSGPLFRPDGGGCRLADLDLDRFRLCLLRLGQLEIQNPIPK